MHKKVFMYGCLTMVFAVNATDLPTLYERTERSPLSTLAYDRQQNAAQWSDDHQAGSSAIHNKSANVDRVIPNITVSIPDKGPIEATFSLSDNQTKYVTSLAAVLLICCTVVATQNTELVVRLLGQK
jgi:hypothetical protein